MAKHAAVRIVVTTIGPDHFSFDVLAVESTASVNSPVRLRWIAIHTRPLAWAAETRRNTARLMTVVAKVCVGRFARGAITCRAVGNGFGTAFFGVARVSGDIGIRCEQSISAASTGERCKRKRQG